MNCSSKITYWEALHSMKYDFNLVQFGKNNFKSNAKASSMIKYQAMYDPKIRREFEELNTDKYITYSITAPDRTTNTENKQVFKTLSYYINQNKQTILNATKSTYFFDNIYKKWEIDNITITENWSQTDYIPFQEFESIELFIDQHTITLNSEQMKEIDIQINLQRFTEYLSEKRFDFLIEKINAEEIAPQNSELLYEAQMQKKWNNLK